MSEPEVIIFPDGEALSLAAAERFAALAVAAVAARGRFLVALSGGTTPQRLFKLLSRPPYTTQIPWAHTHVFWGDERLVPPEDPGSNYYQAQQTLLRHVPVSVDAVHRIRGEWEASAAAADYKEQLRRLAEGERDWPRFDLVLLGMGADGHTASLFPGDSSVGQIKEPVMTATAIYHERPAHRITLTPPVFNDTRHIIFLVTGADKARALAATLRGPFDPQQWPAQRIRPVHGRLTWMIDAEAGQLLKED